MLDNLSFNLFYCPYFSCVRPTTNTSELGLQVIEILPSVASAAMMAAAI